MKELLFCINDITSGQRICPLMSCVNKFVAINYFRNFCLDEEKKGLSRNLYRLEIIGELYPNNDISMFENSIIIQGQYVENILKDELSKLNEGDI